MKTIGQCFKRNIFLNPSPNQKPVSRIVVIFLRFFTYSLNCYLTLIAGLIYYLYVIWIDSEQSSSINFSNLPYDQCFCDILTELGFGQDYCANWESDSSFQNQLIIIPSQLVLQLFLFASLFCHILHSLIIYIPSPLTLIDFYVGLKQDNAKSLATISRQTGSRNNLVHSLAKLRERTNIFKASCCLIAIFYLVGLASSPYYGSILFLGTPFLLHDSLNMY